MGSLVHIERHLTGILFRDNLENCLIPLARLTHGHAFTHDSRHTSMVVKNFISEKKQRVLIWPMQNPDPNPIEHMWQVLKNRLCGKSVKMRHKKLALLQRESSHIGKEVMGVLVRSMKNRCKDSIKANGYRAKY